MPSCKNSTVFPLIWSTIIDRKSGSAPLVQELIKFKPKGKEWERTHEGSPGPNPSQNQGKKANPMDVALLDMWVCVLV